MKKDHSRPQHVFLTDAPIAAGDRFRHGGA